MIQKVGSLHTLLLVITLVSVPCFGADDDSTPLTGTELEQTKDAIGTWVAKAGQAWKGMLENLNRFLGADPPKIRKDSTPPKGLEQAAAVGYPRSKPSVDGGPIYLFPNSFPTASNVVQLSSTLVHEKSHTYKTDELTKKSSDKFFACKISDWVHVGVYLAELSFQEDQSKALNQEIENLEASINAERDAIAKKLLKEKTEEVRRSVNDEMKKALDWVLELWGKCNEMSDIAHATNQCVYGLNDAPHTGSSKKGWMRDADKDQTYTDMINQVKQWSADTEGEETRAMDMLMGGPNSFDQLCRDFLTKYNRCENPPLPVKIAVNFPTFPSDNVNTVRDRATGEEQKIPAMDDPPEDPAWLSSFGQIRGFMVTFPEFCGRNWAVHFICTWDKNYARGYTQVEGFTTSLFGLSDWIDGGFESPVDVEIILLESVQQAISDSEDPLAALVQKVAANQVEIRFASAQDALKGQVSKLSEIASRGIPRNHRERLEAALFKLSKATDDAYWGGINSPYPGSSAVLFTWLKTAAKNLYQVAEDAKFGAVCPELVPEVRAVLTRVMRSMEIVIFAALLGLRLDLSAQAGSDTELATVKAMISSAYDKADAGKYEQGFTEFEKTWKYIKKVG